MDEQIVLERFESDELSLLSKENILVTPKLEEERVNLPDSYAIECSNNMQYLRQYYFIREYAYRYDLKVSKFSGAEDDIDRYSHLIIARKGHFCLGGARLTISTIDRRLKLPLERGDFNILHTIPNLQWVNYCELGRTAFLPQYRDGNCLKDLFNFAVQLAKQYGCSYMVGASPPSVARRFISIFQSLGYPTQILEHITPPRGEENQHMDLRFIIVELNNPILN